LEFAEVFQPDKRAASEGKLITKDPVEFKGMPDGLVGLQEHNSIEQDDRHLAIWGVFSYQNLVQLAYNAFSISQEIGFVDTFPAAGGTGPSGRVLTPLHSAVLIDAHGMNGRKHFNDVLFDL